VDVNVYATAVAPLGFGWHTPSATTVVMREAQAGSE
jgi:hypothetical protein